MERFDIVVLGGGPAGCAAALSLRQEVPSLSVALVEAGGYDGPRIGETLPPNIDGLLRHLGVWQAFLDTGPLAAWGTRACWGSPDPVANEFILQKEGKGWHVDRSRFDRMLASEVRRAGARILAPARVVAHERAGEARRLDLARQTENGETRSTVEARIVIDATGRNSSFAAQQGAARVADDRLAASFLFFDSPQETPADTLIEAFEHGWVYSAALPAGRIAAAIFTDADLLGALDLRRLDGWRAVLDRTPHTRARLGPVPLPDLAEGPSHSGPAPLPDLAEGPPPTRARLGPASPCGEPVIRSAASRQLDAVSGDGWIAAGDAASTFDPLSSQGIYKAIRSGIFASYAVRDGLREPDRVRYDRFIGAEYYEYLDVRAAYYAREQRWPDSPFWRRRHERITLDPAAWIQASAEAPGTVLHLTGAEVEWIRGACAEPLPAHTLTREFLARSQRARPERRVVLALQELLETGALSQPD